LQNTPLRGENISQSPEVLMGLFRSRWSTVCVAVSFGCLFAFSAPARAQMFVELAGGSNVVPTLPSGSMYGSGFNARASIGWKVASNFSWRVDAFASQFDSKDNSPVPCRTFGCSPSAYLHSERVNGLTANALIGVDPRGIFYVLGGAGLYDVNNASLTTRQTLFGVSAGAGLAVPMGSRLRGVVEARWQGLFGVQEGPTSFVPITIGFRY
jgi:hypothetical protein